MTTIDEAAAVLRAAVGKAVHRRRPRLRMRRREWLPLRVMVQFFACRCRAR